MWKLHETIPLFRQWSWECENILMTVTRHHREWTINVNGQISIFYGNATPDDMMHQAERILRSRLLKVIEQLDA